MLWPYLLLLSARFVDASLCSFACDASTGGLARRVGFCSFVCGEITENEYQQMVTQQSELQQHLKEETQRHEQETSQFNLQVKDFREKLEVFHITTQHLQEENKKLEVDLKQQKAATSHLQLLLEGSQDDGQQCNTNTQQMKDLEKVNSELKSHITELEARIEHVLSMENEKYLDIQRLQEDKKRGLKFVKELEGSLTQCRQGHRHQTRPIGKATQGANQTTRSFFPVPAWLSLSLVQTMSLFLSSQYSIIFVTAVAGILLLCVLSIGPSKQAADKNECPYQTKVEANAIEIQSALEQAMDEYDGETVDLKRQITILEKKNRQLTNQLSRITAATKGKDKKWVYVEGEKNT